MPNTRINARLSRPAVKFTEDNSTDVFGYEIRKVVRTSAVLGLALGLAACGGGGSSATSSGGSTTTSGEPTTTSATQLIAAPDTVSTEQNTSVNIDVLANDRGFDAVTPSVSISYDPKHGKVVIRDDGSIAYSPAVGFSGVDSFVYKIADGSGTFAIATATVTVTCSDCVADAQKMTLKWKHVPGNVLGYLVYFGKGLITNPTPVTPVLTKAKVTFDAQADLGLSPGDYACFWVQAVNAAGVSKLSAPACGLV
jgi:hypothetical protein